MHASQDLAKFRVEAATLVFRAPPTLPRLAALRRSEQESLCRSWALKTGTRHSLYADMATVLQKLIGYEE